METRYAKLFDRPTELDNSADGLAEWIDMFGDSLLAKVPESEHAAVIEGVEDRLRETTIRDGIGIADYRRLRTVAIEQ